jgi:hypothetical protein
MKPTDFRIGNYVNNKERLDIVTCLEYITFEDITNVRGQYYEVFIPEPIPLTEEWLLKFGFKHQNKYDLESNLYSKKLNSKYYFTIYSKTETLDFKTKFIGWKVLNIGFDLKIDFVHQLQNLYFALTNEELTPTK